MTVKQVAVTGASRGIGRAIAELFLKNGWRVWALARTEASVAPLKALGDVHFVAFDADDEKSVLDAAHRLTTEAGHLTALVNNAGVARWTGATATSRPRCSARWISCRAGRRFLRGTPADGSTVA